VAGIFLSSSLLHSAPSFSLSLSKDVLMLLSQGIIVSKPLSSLSPNKTAEYHIETLVFQTHCFERVGVQ